MVFGFIFRALVSGRARFIRILHSRPLLRRETAAPPFTFVGAVVFTPERYLRGFCSPLRTRAQSIGPPQLRLGPPLRRRRHSARSADRNDDEPTRFVQPSSRRASASGGVEPDRPALLRFTRSLEPAAAAGRRSPKANLTATEHNLSVSA